MSEKPSIDSIVINRGLNAGGSFSEKYVGRSEMSELIFLSATKMAQAIQKKQVSCEELIVAHLERIEAVNPSLNAVVQLKSEAALERAQEADAALARGENWGVLHGVPITIKDLLETKGIVSTAGTAGRRYFVPAQDATAVKRLRAAGAILLGKTNTPELSLSDETNNPVYGRTNNPYDLTRTPGGSSGGSAAIVAAGGSALDLGSDVGGSLRQPAHFCGVATLKATSGRIPTTGHIPAYKGIFTSLNHVGPIARFVEDLLLVLPIISGVDWQDPSVIPMPLGDPKNIELGRLKVAYYTDNGISIPTVETAQVVQDAVDALLDVGATIQNNRPAVLEKTVSLLHALYAIDGSTQIQQLVNEMSCEIGEELQGWLKKGMDTSVAEIRATSYELVEFRRKMLTFLEQYDVILCPASAVPAVFHGETETIETASYTQTYNLTGWPAAVVRGGTSPEGLPIGIQVIGRPWQEETVLAVASYLEQVLGGWKMPPPLLL
jgi:amidase